MARAGFFTVLSAFILMGAVGAILAGLNSNPSAPSPIPIFIVLSVFGSLVTLGIPYGLGIAVSIMFAEPADWYLREDISS